MYLLRACPGGRTVPTTVPSVAAFFFVESAMEPLVARPLRAGAHSCFPPARAPKSPAPLTHNLRAERVEELTHRSGIHPKFRPHALQVTRTQAQRC
jgi:hypothetical protein